jgi:hypothetical protein
MYAKGWWFVVCLLVSRIPVFHLVSEVPADKLVALPTKRPLMGIEGSCLHANIDSP